MELKEIYSSECPNCGAPLIKKDNILTCKYCGHFYVLPDEHIEDANLNQSLQKHREHPVQEKEKSPEATEQPALAENIPSPAKEKKKNILRKIIKYFIIFLIILITLLTIECVLLYQYSNDDETDIEKTFLQEIYDDSYDSVPYPANSYEDASLSLAVVLENAHAQESDYSLFIRNNRDEAIDLTSPSEHLEIESLHISNDLEENYQCTYEKLKTSRDNLQPGEFIWKGTINCQGKLSPENTSIDVNFEFPNWGKYQFQIPLTSDIPDLYMKNFAVLTRDAYYIDINFLSEIPQIVWALQDDISISDNQGNQYLLDDCTPAAVENNDDGYYYLTLTANDDFYLYRQDTELIRCRYDRPLPADINTMTITINAQGKTFISTTVINEPTGTFNFENQPEE